MKSPNRHIAHLDLDSFYVSVECLRNPELKGKPVLVGGTGDRGVVASCSYEARRFGVHSAMPMKTARRLCSHAIVVRGDMEMYARYSALVTEIIRGTVPLFEKASIDEFYIDMSGMDRFFGCMQYLGALKSKIKNESGLPISYALSSNKLVSKVATNEVKPNGEIEIPFGYEKAYLAPLSITKIPGIGKKTTEILTRSGVKDVKTLSEIPVERLQSILGVNGIELWRKANGIDESPVIPYHEQKSISTEETFSEDTKDVRMLHAEIVRMTERIGFELRSHGKLSGCVTIKLRYFDFKTFTRQQTFLPTNSDQVFIQVAVSLFGQLYDPDIPVRLIGVRLSRLIPGNFPTSLFDDTGENRMLYRAIDDVKRRFGEDALRRAAGVPQISEGVGKFGMKPMDAPGES